MNDQRHEADQPSQPTGPLWHGAPPQTPAYGTPPVGASGSAAPAAPPKRRTSRTPLLVGGLAALLLIGGGAGALLLNPTGSSSQPNTAPQAEQRFPVAPAPVQQASATPENPPIWDIVEEYLKHQKVIKPLKVNEPKLIGVKGNPGLANYSKQA